MPAWTSVLIVEADTDTARFLSDQLGVDGFAPRVARTAAHARALARLEAPSLLLLGDLGERREALELLVHMRAGGESDGSLTADVPVIVVTRNRGQLDRLRAFEAGADDVVAKPLDYAELRARIGAVLRRSAAHTRRRSLALGGLEIDLAARAASVDGKLVRLCRREYELLVHLAGDPYRVFSKHELLRDVWGFRSCGATRTLDSHACRLRRKLAPSGRHYVVNVWGVGYCLKAPPPNAAERGASAGLGAGLV